MPVAVTYPGVYIEEVPSGVRTITSVGTSITAFVDFFREGPMNVATEVFGMADFTRVFGGLDARSEAGYALQQFFLNGGSSALVVRCASGATGTAGVTIGLRTAPATPAITVTAVSAGLWGNTLRVDIDHHTSDPLNVFNLTVTRYASTAPGAGVVAQEKHLNLRLNSSGPRFAPDVLAADSALVRASVPASTTGVPACGGTVSGDLAGLDTAAEFDALRNGQLLLAVGGSGNFTVNVGTWGAGAVTTLDQFASRLEAAIRVASGTAPTPPALTTATVRTVAYGATRHLVVTAGRGDPARSPLDIVAVADGAADNIADDLLLRAADSSQDNVQQYPLNGAATAALISSAAGADGDPPDANALVGAAADAGDQGIYALRKADLFNLLCLPAAALMDDGAMTQVVSSAITFCERSRAFFLLDIPPAINTLTEVKDWLNGHGGFRHRNAAVFFPRLSIPDPLNGFRPRSVGPSGTMAGVFARTDTERGVWKAPAGIEAVLRGLVGMDMKLTDAENGVLNPLAINCLRTFPIYGSVSWGARTLDGADQAGSEWKYTPIRRLALMLEESLFRGTKWVVFEPNDEPLWARIRLNVGAYMTGLFRQGAFQGASPKDAFFVKCDAETTTQADRNLGIVNIHVGFAPLKPAEFVVIKIQQIAGDL